MRHNILLVDDEPRLLDGLARGLHGQPFSVLTAASASQAFDLLQHQQVDLIVSDLSMPNMQGIEFLNCVKERHPQIVRFVLTGKATLEIALRAINEGAVARFFLKPCNTRELAKAIREALQQSELMNMARESVKRLRSQRGILEDLEQEFPGITHIHRGSGGCIVVDEPPETIEDLLNALKGEVEPKG